MSKKPGVILSKDGEIAIYPDGTWVFVCDYKNCQQPCEQGYVRCPKHVGAKYPELSKARQMQQLQALLSNPATAADKFTRKR